MATFRAYLPGGGEYVGIGVQPDILVRPTIEDIRNGADPVLEAGEMKLTAKGWTSLDGAIEYEFEEESLSATYREIAASNPQIVKILGENVRIPYRKQAGGAGSWELPWLDPKRLAGALPSLLKGGDAGGVTDRLKDLLRRGK